MKNIAVKKVIQKLQPEEITTFLWEDNSVLHRHSDWEFTSTVDGTGCNVVNGTPYDLMLSAYAAGNTRCVFVCSLIPSTFSNLGIGR